MSFAFVDLSPVEAVSRAREVAVEQRPAVLEALDRHLRRQLLVYVQDRTTPPAALREGLLAACRWAEGEKLDPWCRLWPYLLELLRDAEETPALAGDLHALRASEGRAAEVLALLAHSPRPLQPSTVAERLGMSVQQVSNLVGKLESARLIVRRRAGGRATWLFASSRGSKLAELLPATGSPEKPSAARKARPPADEASQGAEPIRFWDYEAMQPAFQIH